MTYQTSANVLAAAHRETAINVQATATGATQIRLIQTPGLQLKRANVQSAEKLSTGLRSMSRAGYKSVEGSFDSELSVGGWTDMAVEAVQRSAWVTSFSVGFATMTTVAIGTNYLTAAGGDWAGTEGLRVGDIFTLSGTTVSGDNSTNHFITALTSLTITTVTGAFTTLAATATGTLTVLKKVTSPSAAYTRYSHTIEQNDTDIDASEIFTGCRVIAVRIQGAPGQMVKMTTQLLGVDRTTVTGGSAPYFTSPTLTTSLGLLMDDSTLRYNGAPATTFTSFDLNFQITAKGEPTIGSLTTADIFDNDMVGSGTISGLRSDFSNLTLFDAETEFEFFALLQEPTGTPPACFGIYLPRLKITDLNAPFGGGDGAKIETLQFTVGPKTADATHDYGYCSFSSSAA